MILADPKVIVRTPRPRLSKAGTIERSSSVRRGPSGGTVGGGGGGASSGIAAIGGLADSRLGHGAPTRRGPGGLKKTVGKEREGTRKPGSKYGGEKKRGGARKFVVAAEASGRGSLRRKRSRKSGRGLGEEKIAVVKHVALEEGAIQVQDLATKLGAKGSEVVKYLMMDMGVMATLTQSIDMPAAKAVAEAFGFLVNAEITEGKVGSEECNELSSGDEAGENVDAEEGAEEDASGVVVAGAALFYDDPASLVKLAPVVTIMGHVDHGKTSLLDAIRQADVVSGEAGGITQHVGAYQVKTDDGEPITFIDTPGHAAFSEMRQRGADATDIVVLVVAADDGVKDQTSDSLAAAKQAGKPVIVAFNKIDKEGADVARVASELTTEGLLIESLGGDVLSADISAKKRIGLGDLLDKILLQAEVLDLKANPAAPASGTIIEAKVEKGVGTVATTLIQRGTLRVGDPFVAGEAYGKVRTLVTDKGQRVDEAGPATPVSVTGLDGVPAAGDQLLVGENTAMLRQLALSRSKISREQSAARFDKDLRQSISDMLAEGGSIKEMREVNVLIKADVQGSAEALSTALKTIIKEDEICQVRTSPSGAYVRNQPTTTPILPLPNLPFLVYKSTSNYLCRLK
jgi:translation initiation factor IF-2